MNKCILTRKADLAVSNWSGGSTTQLFLYPSSASYAARDFQIRISSATVEQTPSAFTSLPGYHRVLMPLSAPLKLVFENHGEAERGPFEPVEFEGEWNTVSFGLCTDIGIMLAAGWRGSLKAIGSGKYECATGFAGVYALTDGVKASVTGEDHTLMQGDFLLLEMDTAGELEMSAQTKDAAILARVFR
ncbi:MAG: HutD family protein [Treponema sp.]|nr:HutD family protein [Treponema sp.]